MTGAMKTRDEMRLSALRMLKTALKKQEVDSMKPLDEKAELQVLNMLIKQRREAAQMFRQGGRPELADKEEAELKLIEAYMPAPASDEEIEALAHYLAHLFVGRIAAEIGRDDGVVTEKFRDQRIRQVDDRG